MTLTREEKKREEDKEAKQQTDVKETALPSQYLALKNTKRINKQK